MSNPFTRRTMSLSGPATDIVPVVPSDSANLADIALALYIETGGALTIEPVQGSVRTVQVADFSILPVGVKRVHATGTTALGIHALVLG